VNEPGSRVSPKTWLAGARPRTLGVSVAPVLVGTAVAAAEGRVVGWRALAALVVAVAIQVGTNYANDYSDGVRGTDAARQGPLRLTASGVVAPAAVRRAALLAFAVAALAGTALAVAVDLRLLLVGVAAIAAGVFYTGGPSPYGYKGFGELSVLVFFGFVATAGSAYVHLERVPSVALAAAVPVGLLACAVLLVNNLRDLVSDREAGKRTLAVRLGAPKTEALYTLCVLGSLAVVFLIGLTHPPVLLGVLAAPLALPPLRLMATRRDAPGLVQALIGTARLQLVVSVLMAWGLWNS
jgi:1,4-dihydroxy-2-naphthoate polyprenyltransferase